jgi:hypothetical protein
MCRCFIRRLLLHQFLLHHTPAKSDVVESIHAVLRHVLVRIRLELTSLRRNPATKSRVEIELGWNVAIAVRLPIFHQLVVAGLPSLVTLALAPFESKSIEIGNLGDRQARAQILFVSLLLHALLIHPTKAKATKASKQNDGIHKRG